MWVRLWNVMMQNTRKRLRVLTEFRQQTSTQDARKPADQKDYYVYSGTATHGTTSGYQELEMSGG